MKTSELTGTALDWAVAKALGKEVEVIDFDELGCGCVQTEPDPFMNHSRCWAPSRYWQQAGPIIEQGRIGLFFDRACGNRWRATHKWVTPDFLHESALDAAMRCFVASVLGDEVDLPDELTTCAEEGS